MESNGSSSACRRSPYSIPLMVLSAVYMVWSVWAGVVLWVGGTIPLIGWEVEPRPVWSIAWFAVCSWLVFFVLAMVVVGVPYLVIESLQARRRGRRPGGTG